MGNDWFFKRRKSCIEKKSWEQILLIEKMYWTEYFLFLNYVEIQRCSVLFFLAFNIIFIRKQNSFDEKLVDENKNEKGIFMDKIIRVFKWHKNTFQLL